MRSVRGRGRFPIALTVLGVALAGGVAFGAVMARDLTRQLELIDVANGGIVVYGTITDSTTAEVGAPNEEPLPFTVLTVKVDRAVAPETTSGTVKVFVPGVEDRKLSISPSEAETRVGESVLLFLRVDQNVRAVDAHAYKLDSFAEVFRTQKNRKGDVVVLGEGGGSAIVENGRLSELTTTVRAQFDLVRSRAK